jgi:hypothetical protein
VVEGVLYIDMNTEDMIAFDIVVGDQQRIDLVFDGKPTTFHVQSFTTHLVFQRLFVSNTMVESVTIIYNDFTCLGLPLSIQ